MTKREHAMLRLALDLAILTVRDETLQVLTITRGNEPFRGQPALPGGFLRDGEDLRTAALRELRDETGLDGATMHLEQLSTYGAPDRDPRGRIVSVAYLAIVPDLPAPRAGSDAAEACWTPVSLIRGRLAFDHDEILDDAVERARTHLEFTTLATAFCGPNFTIGDLRKIYEVVWGRPLDPRNFNRKVVNTQGFIEPIGEKRAPHLGRPATLYRSGNQRILNPPILRSTTAAP
jgi:8-oxo-dGTP diphosphatase